jgi:DNA-binding NarL/FixJ family response regulator
MSTATIKPSSRDPRSGARDSRNGVGAARPGELDLMLVADDLAARYSVWALLRWRREIRTIAIAGSSIEALTLAQHRRPHVCLIAATLGRGDGLALATRMKQLVRPPRVLIFADAVDTRLAGATLLSGADGLLWRYADADQQASVIRRVVTGEQHFPDLERDEVLALLDRLEDRDRPIAALLLERVPPDDIARTMGISARDLQRRRTTIRDRLANLPQSAPSADQPLVPRAFRMRS